MSAIYETDKLLAEYLLFHYGTADEILPPEHGWPDGMRAALDFAVRTTAHFSGEEVERGLDLGCAVGRSTFEMARHCRQVTGLDFSHAFIRAAERLRSGERLAYERLEEAHQHTVLHATAPADVEAARVRFMQGDAMHLPADLGAFDRVHAANLLCRLPEPLLLLQGLPSLVKPGGELVLATPCTWLSSFTPPDRWPKVGTFQMLRDELSPAFDLVKCCEEPFLIRETARKFQWTKSLLTVWQRKAAAAPRVGTAL